MKLLWDIITGLSFYKWIVVLIFGMTIVNFIFNVTFAILSKKSRWRK